VSMMIRATGASPLSMFTSSPALFVRAQRHQDPLRSRNIAAWTKVWRSPEPFSGWPQLACLPWPCGHEAVFCQLRSRCSFGVHQLTEGSPPASASSTVAAGGDRPGPHHPVYLSRMCSPACCRLFFWPRIPPLAGGWADCLAPKDTMWAREETALIGLVVARAAPAAFRASGPAWRIDLLWRQHHGALPRPCANQKAVIALRPGFPRPV